MLQFTLVSVADISDLNTAILLVTVFPSASAHNINFIGGDFSTVSLKKIPRLSSSANKIVSLTLGSVMKILSWSNNDNSHVDFPLIISVLKQ